MVLEEVVLEETGARGRKEKIHLANIYLTPLMKGWVNAKLWNNRN